MYLKRKLFTYSLSTLGFALLGLTAVAPAHALLGGFEASDGYLRFLNEVTKYNAGQFGANAGGGSSTAITDGTGLWYNMSGLQNKNSFATGYQFYDRQHRLTNAQALMITTNSEGWNGPAMKYGYHLDSNDLNGLSPANTAGKKININFWWCPTIHGTSEGGGLGAGTIGDTIEFVDSKGHVGFTVGLKQPSTSTDYVGYNNGSGFVQTNVVGYNTGYSNWDITLDLANKTVTASYWDVLTNTSYSLLNGAGLAASMSDFTEMRFASTAGIKPQNALLLDDFKFTVGSTNNAVPEPGVNALLLGMATTGISLFLRRRTSRKK